MCIRLRAPPLPPGVPLCPRPQRSRTRSLHRAGPRRTAARKVGELPPSPCRRRRERTTSTGSHRATHPRAPRPHHATILLHSMVNFLLFLGMPGLDVRGECSEASQLPFPPVGPLGLSSLRSRLCVRSCGNNLRSLESQREVPGRAAQTHPGTKMDDGIARVRFHSIIASRPALITILYQTSVNVSTMTVTASQTGGRARRGRRSCSGCRAADKRAPLERPAQRSRSRSLPGCSRLHRRLPSPSPHRQPAHLPGHAGAQLDERAVLRERGAALKEELKDLKRRRRDLRAAAPIQAERGG